MVCRDCKFMKPVDVGYYQSLYYCSNPNSDHYMEYTGTCCEDECEDGEEF